jgi:hypothetical protein
VARRSDVPAGRDGPHARLDPSQPTESAIRNETNVCVKCPGRNWAKSRKLTGTPLSCVLVGSTHQPVGTGHPKVTRLDWTVRRFSRYLQNGFSLRTKLFYLCVMAIFGGGLYIWLRYQPHRAHRDHHS